MSFDDAFQLSRPLGGDGEGGFLPFPALTAIHMAHRLGALVLVPALLVLAWRLLAGGDPSARPWALGLVAIAAWQTASGLGNVLLGWPLVAAVAHTGGAAALVVVLTFLIARARVPRAVAAMPWSSGPRPFAS
jgi:cytochrome c oxidase assembly protein subunit 15